MKRIINWLTMLLVAFSLVTSPSWAQLSSQGNFVAPVINATATGQTSAPITLGQVPSGAGGSFSVGNITVNGTGLTTVTFQVLGSSDGGNTYTPLNVNAISVPATLATTTTATVSGIYQVNLSGITTVKIATSGTFTATSVAFTLTASPNGTIARNGTGGGGGATTPATSNLLKGNGSANGVVAATPNTDYALPSPLTVSQSVAGTTYYVDSLNGLDANSGSSPSAAWKTVAHVNAATIASGSQVLFLSTGVWHEQITAQSTGIIYGAYGPQRNCTLSPTLVAYCTNMPIIDGADVVTGWSVQSGANYKAAYTATASKGFVDSLYQQTTPLALQTSIANVTSTAGSIYSDGTNVYVHLFDGSNPANHVVEISGSRKYGVNLNSQANTVVNGLEVIRTAKSGIVAPNQASFNGVTISSNVLFNNGDTLGDGIGAGSSNEGAIYGYSGFFGTTFGNWLVSGNWVGRMDYNHGVLDYNQAGIQLGSLASTQIVGNKIATVNGDGIRINDSNSTSCTGTVISENEITNSEGNIWNYGCQSTVVTYNNVHDSFGNFLEIANGSLTADLVNNAPYVAFNTFHDILPAYGNGLFNGIDTNYSTNGTYTGNTCYRVSAACLTLEGSGSAATSSSGSIVIGNNFDASQNFSSTGASGSGTAYPLYSVATATGGTQKLNTLIYSPTSGVGEFWLGNSYSTGTLFETANPGINNQGAAGNFNTLSIVGPTPSFAGYGIYASTAPYAGGSSTTTYPLFGFVPSSTAVTSWNTGGTFIGINAQSGFGGNFLDFHLNGGASLGSAAFNGLWTLPSLSLPATGFFSSYVLNIPNAPYSGGSATTTFPQFGQTPGATAVTTWNTGGTFHGINAQSGFTGNFLDFHLNGGASLFAVSSSGTISYAGLLSSTTLYSAAGTALPGCGSALKGTEAHVSDATSPTFMGAYTSGGGITASVICSYNGTTYAWLTH